MKRKFKLSTTHKILLSFLLTILLGSLLLSLPISSANGKSVSYIDALFTSTTSICVTGLVTMPTVSTWSFFGQLVILILIQIGGLGVITIMSGLMISLHRKLDINDRMLIQDAFSLNTLSGIVKFTKKVIIGTFVVEGVGALLYMTVFVPEFGIKGIWISIFNSISAFCNAGIDIISENSLCDYALNPMINAVTCFLIIAGGIGFIVWWDIIQVLKSVRKKKFKIFSSLTLHSKIVLSTTIILISVGAVAFFIFEYNNPLTMKDYSLFDRIQTSIFQSVTTRTAGFATIPQQDLTNASAFFSLFLMFIGGSPIGTAGGIKTVTIAILLYTAFATIRNEKDVVIFHRTIPKQVVDKSCAMLCISFATVFISTILLSVVMNTDSLNIIYETVSATATVGLTRNLTGELNLWGKLIIIFTMYLGRVGPMSFVTALNTKKKRKKIVKEPTEEIFI